MELLKKPEPSCYLYKKRMWTFTMFTSEMLSILSTCTSMPTGMAEPTEQNTQSICMQDNSNAFEISLERNCLCCSYRESIWSPKCYSNPICPIIN